MGQIMEKLKGALLAIALWTGLIMLGGKANAGVTMDVDKWYGPSGTYRCVDVKACYMLYHAANVRGDTYYCNSVVIKRDGKVVWFRTFYR